MTGLKLPRTVRLDPSDTFVFENPAKPGEWAVTGSFLFFDTVPESLSAKARAAFRSGFVGVTSLGFSTLVVVSEASEDEREEAVASLARHIFETLGAPDFETAIAAAHEEIAVAASLCQPAIGAIIAMHRTSEDGEFRESFRTLNAKPPGMPGADRMHAHARAFTSLEVDDEPEDVADLIGLMENPAR